MGPEMKPKTGFGVNASFCFKFALMQPGFSPEDFFLLPGAFFVHWLHA
jgi:hypothetical protein